MSKKKKMDGCVAFAMVLGPGEMDGNSVSCNASDCIELLHAHFFTHNDWIGTSFHFIVLLIGFLPALIHLFFYQTLLLSSIDATISLLALSVIVE